MMMPVNCMQFEPMKSITLKDMDKGDDKPCSEFCKYAYLQGCPKGQLMPQGQ